MVWEIWPFMFDIKQFYLLRTTIIVKVVVGKNILYLQVIRYCSAPDVRVPPLTTFTA